MRYFTLPLAAALFFAGCGGGGSSASLSAIGSDNQLLVQPLANAVSTPAPGALGEQTIGLSFTAANASQAFLATEDHYSGTFTTTSTCNGATPIASLSPTSGTGPAAVFTITALSAGNCEFTVLDSTSKSAAVLVTVTTTTGGIQ